MTKIAHCGYLNVRDNFRYKDGTGEQIIRSHRSIGPWTLNSWPVSLFSLDDYESDSRVSTATFSDLFALWRFKYTFYWIIISIILNPGQSRPTCNWMCQKLEKKTDLGWPSVRLVLNTKTAMQQDRINRIIIILIIIIIIMMMLQVLKSSYWQLMTRWLHHPLWLCLWLVLAVHLVSLKFSGMLLSAVCHFYTPVIASLKHRYDMMQSA